MFKDKILNNDMELLIKGIPYRRALNLSGLDRLYPFCHPPEFIEKKDYLEINYYFNSEIHEAVKNDQKPESEGYFWMILPTKNIYLRFRDLASSTSWATSEQPIKGIWEVPEIYLHITSVPDYIRTFCEYIITSYKSSAIQIFDYLPLYFSLEVTTKFNLKNKKMIETTLLDIANYIVRDSASKNKVDAIIKNSDKTFNERFDELFALSKRYTYHEFSYCLGCGKNIKLEKKFCDASQYEYDNKDNCLNKFNYWLKARLGIESTEERANMRDHYYNKLQDLIDEHPLTAFDKFERANKKLYEKRYKERWAKKD